MIKYQPVIGLEVHIELSTKSKMFCGCTAEHFSKTPNCNVCPVCMGLPGAMPTPNSEAIRNTILFGLSMKCDLNLKSKFDRKHYFYPDLPKSYQISQYDLPFCKSGIWKNSIGKDFRIRRIHLEEDTGKLQHQMIDGKKTTLIDFNRSGVALMELVTEPDFSDTVEILEFLKDIQLLARYLKISNADMEKGSMRLEANISLRPVGSDILPDYKIELKNINSFRFLKNAIESEIKRQTDILLSGNLVGQETRGFDEKTGDTFLQRTKEDAKDYRYFPEPDIPFLEFSNTYIENLKDDLTETPWDKRKRLINDYGINLKYAEILVSDIGRCDYFEKLCALAKKYKVGIKTVSDLMINKNLDKKYPEPEMFIFEVVKIMKRDYSRGEDVEDAVSMVLQEEALAVSDYKKGKGQVVGFLLGMVQKKLDGKGNVDEIRNNLLTKLNVKNE